MRTLYRNRGPVERAVTIDTQGLEPPPRVTGTRVGPSRLPRHMPWNYASGYRTEVGVSPSKTRKPTRKHRSDSVPQVPYAAANLTEKQRLERSSRHIRRVADATGGRITDIGGDGGR